MADIELVITIPEEEYRWIKKSDNSIFADVAEKECMLYAIKNGILLPKGHGRIIDEDKITKCEQIGLIIKDGNITRCLKTDAPTIIERYHRKRG